MKKIIILFIFFLIASVSYSEEINESDITTSFKTWLLSNEAKAMSELGLAEEINTKYSTPFIIMPKKEIIPQKAEEKLWDTHRKIYQFLNEVQSIYNLAKHFGNGKFAVIIKKARPEVWGYSSFYFIGFCLPRSVISESRKVFLNNLFSTIGVDSKRDVNLSDRLKKTIRNMKDNEFRMLREYISIYKALYPRDNSVSKLEQFLTQGTQKQFANSLTEILKSANSNSSESLSEDSLSELDSLTDSKAEEEAKPISQMEAADPYEVEVYDIWENQ